MRVFVRIGEHSKRMIAGFIILFLSVMGFADPESAAHQRNCTTTGGIVVFPFPPPPCIPNSAHPHQIKRHGSSSLLAWVHQTDAAATRCLITYWSQGCVHDPAPKKKRQSFKKETSPFPGSRQQQASASRLPPPKSATNPGS